MIVELRRRVDAEHLLAREEMIGRLNLEGAANAEVHAVERALVANDELVTRGE